MADDSARLLLAGNEAVALAAAHAAVSLGTGYPGTPSTEILETLASFGDPAVITRWAPNEKVALEVGLGAAFAGARTLVTMKHVGLNVAADPLFTAAYTGVRGGLVLVTADGPAMHSSQNEQDNRHYAAFAGLPMLEPASSQEAYDFARLAFALSEELGTIVLLRPTTRICHSKSLVEPGEPEPRESAHRFERDIAQFVMVPANARRRHVVLEAKLGQLRDPRGRNMAALGRLSTHLDIDPGRWHEAIRHRMPPKSIDDNIAAFDAGRAALVFRFEDNNAAAKALMQADVDVLKKIDLLGE